MFIDDASTLKLGRLSLSKIGNGTSTANVVYLHYAWRKLCYIHIWRGLSVLLIRKTGSQDLSVG